MLWFYNDLYDKAKPMHLPLGAEDNGVIRDIVSVRLLQLLDSRNWTTTHTIALVEVG